jgi:hypothetical protein
MNPFAPHIDRTPLLLYSNIPCSNHDPTAVYLLFYPSSSIFHPPTLVAYGTSLHDRYDFVPDVLDRHPPVVDTWIKIGDDEALPAAMRLIKEEALLVGGSSGSALAGALRWFKTEQGQKYANEKGKNVVVILPDG